MHNIHLLVSLQLFFPTKESVSEVIVSKKLYKSVQTYENQYIVEDDAWPR